MEDKRRKARIQGGWSTPANNNPRPRLATDTAASSPKPPVVGASFSQSTGYGFFCGCESITPNPDLNASANRNPGQKKSTHEHGPLAGSLPVRTKHNFQFKPDAEPIATRPEEMMLTSGGRHILSVSPEKGTSRLSITHDFIEPSEQGWIFEQLLAEIPWQQESIRASEAQGGHLIPQPRMTCWFGDFPYTYSGLTLAPLKLSPLLEILRDRIQEKTGMEFNSLLANLYRDDKDSVDWHSDKERSLGKAPTIASLSLGATRIFELRQNPVAGGNDFSLSQHVKVPLSAGMLVIMQEAVQDDWMHRVPREYHHREPRINLTFRKIHPKEASS